jgi:preprotein translocase subunit Sss1
MKELVKAIVKDDIKGNNKKPNLKELKEIVKITKTVIARAERRTN